LFLKLTKQPIERKSNNSSIRNEIDRKIGRKQLNALNFRVNEENPD
jgi:hypothetical protein